MEDNNVYNRLLSLFELHLYFMLYYVAFNVHEGRLNMAGEHSGHRQRMRERYLTQGLDGFAPHEVLELILFFAIPQRNVNPLAHSILKHFGSLHAVFEADSKELQKVSGVGEYAATLISLFLHVAKKTEQSRAGEKTHISNRIVAERYCINLLGGLKQEHFYAVCLNGQMQVIHDALIARGSISEVQAYPRIVADAVLRHNAYAVLLCHNHPAGSPIPSHSDLETTSQLLKLLESIEVIVADHIIVAGDSAFSMVGCGMLEQTVFGNSVLIKASDSAGEILIRHELEKKLGKKTEKSEQKNKK